MWKVEHNSDKHTVCATDEGLPKHFNVMLSCTALLLRPPQPSSETGLKSGGGGWGVGVAAGRFILIIMKKQVSEKSGLTQL